MNLAAKRLRLLFVADALPDELAHVVEFLNEQMPYIEVLAVEILAEVRMGLGAKDIAKKVQCQRKDGSAQIVIHRCSHLTHSPVVRLLKLFFAFYFAGQRLQRCRKLLNPTRALRCQQRDHRFPFNEPQRQGS